MTIRETVSLVWHRFRKPDLRLQLPKRRFVEMPDLGLTRDKCRKMTAEEIYAVLEQTRTLSKMNRNNHGAVRSKAY